MEDEVSTCIWTWRKRLRHWYKDIVFKPPSHGLRWRGLWVLQMTLLPNCCLTVLSRPVWCEKRVHHLSGADFLAKIMGSVTHDWPGNVDSVSPLHTVFCKWRVLHLRKVIISWWFQQALIPVKNIPARFPAKSNHTQCGHEIQPAISQADPFLCLNGPEWYE